MNYPSFHLTDLSWTENAEMDLKNSRKLHPYLWKLRIYIYIMCACIHIYGSWVRYHTELLLCLPRLSYWDRFCELQQCYVLSWRSCLCKYKGKETTDLSNTWTESTLSHWANTLISDETWSLLSTKWDDVETNVWGKSVSGQYIGTGPQLSSHASLISPRAIILPLALLAFLLQAGGSSRCTALLSSLEAVKCGEVCVEKHYGFLFRCEPWYSYALWTLNDKCVTHISKHAFTARLRS